MNIVVTELGKATNVQKLELEKELSQFVEIHDFADKYTSNSKKSTIRPSASDAADKLALSSAKLPSPERTPLLATSSVHHLLQLALDSLKLDNPKNGASSQKNSQSLSVKSQTPNSKIISSILNMCLRQLKFFSIMGKDDPLKTLIYGEIKLLGPPLLNIIVSLKPKAETDLSKKEAKGQKDVECRKEHTFLALLCLKKVIEISLVAPKYVSLIDDLVSASTIAVDAEDECKLAEGSKELFIRKITRPLLNEFLEFSFFREAEVCFHFIYEILGPKAEI